MKRRHFLSTTSAALAATALSGCKKSDQPVLRIYTWADYLAPDLAKRFEKENNCTLQIDTFDSNEAMYAKLTAGASGYDLLTPSSYMVKTLVRDKMLQPLDAAKLPNLKHVDADYLKRALDPTMAHSVPYMMASTCLGWLGSKVSNPVASYSMLDRADLKGRITLLDDMREVLGAALRSPRLLPQLQGSRPARPGPRRRRSAGRRTSPNSTTSNTRAVSPPESSTSSKATPETCCKWLMKIRTSS